MNENKANVLIIDDGRTEIGTAQELYKAIRDEVTEYWYNNDYTAYNMQANIDVMYELENIINDEVEYPITEERHYLYMVRWDANDYPTLSKLKVSE